MSKIIKLNIVYDYPVRWDRFMIMRDFIQNFYDSAGYGQWHALHKIETGSDYIKLTINNEGFSHEWLLYLGASTKRHKNAVEANAGYYGEGFKMAALCAVRDMKWKVEAASRDWRLIVTTKNVAVEGRMLQSLAYEIYEAEQYFSGANIVIKNMDEEDCHIFQSVLKHFYYPQNPLIAKLIFENSKYKIFHRSEVENPRLYSMLVNTRGGGVVFCNYQLRAFIDAPLVIFVKGYHKNDRDRSYLNDSETLEILFEASLCLDASAAYEVLTLIRKKWGYMNAARKYSYWPRIIDALIEKILKNDVLKNLFKIKYNKIYAMKPLDSRDSYSIYRRRAAMVWHKKNKPGFDLVVSEFEALGIELLENACEAEGGYPVVRKPDKFERTKISKLIKIATKMLPPCFISRNISNCRVFDDYTGGTTLGRAILSKRDSIVSAKYQFLKAIKEKCRQCKEKMCGFDPIAKYELEGVELNSKLLTNKDFAGALAVYIHELAHIYGQDGSDKFGRALERAIRSIIDKV